jgi:hypothetical protein
MIFFNGSAPGVDRLNRESAAYPAACGGVSERILKKTAFLTVEDSLQLAAGIFNPVAKARVSLPISECNNKKSRRRSQPAVRFPGLALENLHYSSIYKT